MERNCEACKNYVTLEDGKSKGCSRWECKYVERMTREKAKKRLEVWLICGECPEDKQCYDSHLHSTCEYTDYCDEVSLTDAVKVAISALSENKGEDRPKGEWDVNCQGIVFCSKCKKVINHNYDIDYMESHFNFCPNCGADMRGE